MMERDNIEAVVSWFISKSAPRDRFSSFDYCYNYFVTNKNFGDDVEKSCLVLGFYLASWGMFRGSSFLLKKSAKHFEPLIEYLASLDRNVWSIDVDSYSDTNIETILSLYHEIKSRVIDERNSHVVLITKIMLGVFGFIPAFDNYFTETFRTISNDCRFRKVNKNSLNQIRRFYEANKATIDRLSGQIYTTDFVSSRKTNISYPKGKIIDMYGFGFGQRARTGQTIDL